MAQPRSVSDQEPVVDTMIGLTRLTGVHRAIIAGSGSMEFYLALRRRGFLRVATAATCRIPKGQHAVALITGRNSLQAIEAALVELSRFLSTSASVAVLIDSREIGAGQRNPGKTGANGLSDRSRCQVPGGLRAFRHPARFRPDGKCSVKFR
jgi:hypothetical protein